MKNRDDGSAKPLLRALSGAVLAAPPFWLMRQAGRYLPEYRALRAKAPGFLEFCLNPELAAEATLQPLRRFGMDGAILFSDILVIPHALGRKVAFREGEGPLLEPLRKGDDLSIAALDGFEDRLAPVYATVRKVAADLPGEAALIGFAGGPWTVATYLVEGRSSRDFATVKTWALADPESFARLIDVVTEATIRHLAAQAAAGAEALQLFDSWAGVLPEAAFRRFVIAPTRRIIDELRRRCPHVPIIGFPRGAGLLYRAYTVETGVTAIGLDSTVPCAYARESLQSLVPVQGNLDPLVLCAGGAAMEAAVWAIRQHLAGGPFVFNLGHGVVPETPVEHVAQLAALLRRPA